MSENSTINPETPKVSESNSLVSPKVSEKTNPTFGKGFESKPKVSEKVTEKIVTKGNVSELVRSETPKKTEETPKVSEKTSSETPKVSGKSTSETSSETDKVSKPKKKMTPKQLANLKRGNKKTPKEEIQLSETPSETIPKFNMNLPVKVLIVMAFVVGATIGGFGLWKWWKDSRKKKQVPETDYLDIPEEMLEGISQEDLEKLTQEPSNE